MCVGTITQKKELQHLVIRPLRHDTIYELNNWLFDYFRINSEPIIQLPPLDDWTQSDENPTVWSYIFGKGQWEAITQESL